MGRGRRGVINQSTKKSIRTCKGQREEGEKMVFYGLKKTTPMGVEISEDFGRTEKDESNLVGQRTFINFFYKIKSYFSYVFLPRGAQKFSYNVPNCVKSNKHCIFKSALLLNESLNQIFEMLIRNGGESIYFFSKF